MPPFTTGKVFRYDGSHNKRVRFENPPGLATPITPTAAQKAQVCRVGFFEEIMREVPGYPVVAGDR